MNIPEHVAIIMDGNGRWAKERGMVRVQGHNAGMKSLKEIVRTAGEAGVKYLTVYAFSTENWKRPQDEVSGIFKLVVKYMKLELNELHANNVRVNLIGDWHALPEDARSSLEFALEKTKNNTGMVFTIALNYGGRAEILKAVREIAEKAAKGLINAEDITEECLSASLYTGDMPDPDLIIRTGGEYRLSNFLTWQSAYSELYVTDVYWPDFTGEEFLKALDVYGGRERRYGGLK